MIDKFIYYIMFSCLFFVVGLISASRYLMNNLMNSDIGNKYISGTNLRIRKEKNPSFGLLAGLFLVYAIEYFATHYKSFFESFPYIVMTDWVIQFILTTCHLLSIMFFLPIMNNIFERFFTDFKKSRLMVVSKLIIIICSITFLIDFVFFIPEVQGLSLMINQLVPLLYIWYLCTNRGKANSQIVSRYYPTIIFTTLIYIISMVIELLNGCGIVITDRNIFHESSRIIMGILMIIVFEKESSKLVIENVRNY